MNKCIPKVSQVRPQASKAPSQRRHAQQAVSAHIAFFVDEESEQQLHFCLWKHWAVHFLELKRSGGKRGALEAKTCPLVGDIVDLFVAALLGLYCVFLRGRPAVLEIVIRGDVRRQASTNSNFPFLVGLNFGCFFQHCVSLWPFFRNIRKSYTLWRSLRHFLSYFYSRWAGNVSCNTFSKLTSDLWAYLYYSSLNYWLKFPKCW